MRVPVPRPVLQLATRWRLQVQSSRRRKELRALFGSFLSRGDLVFDVGAHAGDYTELMLGLGARVVAFEPQPEMVHELTRRFRGREDVEVVPQGLADVPGRREMAVAEATTVSTMEPEWVSTMSSSGRFGEMAWNLRVEVDVTTLDHAIERHGRPDFVKIDVEGYEPTVLAGLSEPVPLVCFEFVAERPQATAECVRRLNALGLTEFNFVDETAAPALASHSWLSAEDLLARLNGLPRRDAWGDIFARVPAAER